jgi:hypothetical protein
MAFNFQDPRVTDIMNMLNVELSKIPTDSPFRVLNAHFGRIVRDLEAVLADQVGRELTNGEREYLAGSFTDLLNQSYHPDRAGVSLFCRLHTATVREAHYYEVGFWHGQFSSQEA